MNTRDALKIAHRIEEDIDLLKRMVRSASEERFIIDGKAMRSLQLAIISILGHAETIDSYLNSFEYIGRKSDQYIPTKFVLENTTDITVENPLPIDHHGK